MKHILYISLVLISITSFFSCQRTVYNRTAKGHIVDATTGQPIAGAWVSLHGTCCGYGGLFSNNSSTVTKDTAISTSDGNFEFIYRKGRNSDYEVHASAPNYFLSKYEEVRLDPGHKLEIKLHPIATLILDVNKVSNASHVYLIPELFDFPLNNVCSATQQYFNYKVQGNKMVNVTYYVIFSAANEVRHDTSIYCPSFKSTILRIEY